MQSAPAPSRKRLRLRFTLRLLLAAITLLCIWLAIHTQRARQQRRIVEHIQATYGSVVYDCGPASKTGVHSPVPRWLLARLGMDFFHSVTSAHVRGEVELSEVAKLSSLKDLTIWKEDLSDSDMAHVARLHNLQSLVIQSDMHRQLPGDYPDTTRIADPSLAILASMPKLAKVYLEGTRFTGQGLAALAASKSLRDVDIRNCDASVTPADVEPLRQSRRITKLAIWRWTESKGEEVVASW